jgi:hypothetical protein
MIKGRPQPPLLVIPLTRHSGLDPESSVFGFAVVLFVIPAQAGIQCFCSDPSAYCLLSYSLLAFPVSLF